MSDKLTINNEMRVLDAKDRTFYDSLDEQERKKFGVYLMMRYSASVEGSADFQEWYLRSANERVNQNFFDISASRHAKLLWLMCTTVSPGMGTQKHYWITPKKKESKATASIKLLRRLYPGRKADEIELLAELNDLKEIKEMARRHGLDDREIKEYSK
jgi:hypothetical protein